MTTARNIIPSPDVPLPAGADPEHVDNWEPGYGGVVSRLVWSPAVKLTGRLEQEDVRIVATQRLDGSLITDDPREGPLVYIGCDDYTVAEARMFAQAVIDAADLADKWVQP